MAMSLFSVTAQVMASIWGAQSILAPAVRVPEESGLRLALSSPYQEGVSGRVSYLVRPGLEVGISNPPDAGSFTDLRIDARLRLIEEDKVGIIPELVGGIRYDGPYLSMVKFIPDMDVNVYGGFGWGMLASGFIGMSKEITLTSISPSSDILTMELIGEVFDGHLSVGACASLGSHLSFDLAVLDLTTPVIGVRFFEEF